MLRSCSFLVVMYLASAFGADAVHAQAYGRVEETASNADSYYYHVRPGAATVQIEVLGAVGAPGLYEVSEGTQLRQLLALTGGPMIGTREQDRRRHIWLVLYRPTVMPGEPYQRVDLNSVLADANSSFVLLDGDAVSVEVVERRRIGWRDVVTIIGGTASLALAIERFANLN